MSAFTRIVRSWMESNPEQALALLDEITTPSLATPARVVTEAKEATMSQSRVAYRKADGSVHTCTEAQFTQRQNIATAGGKPLTLLTGKAKKAALQAASASASTPAPVVSITKAKSAKASKPTKTSARSDRKAARHALAAALRAQGLNPGDPQVWAAAKAEAGIK